MLLTAAGGLLFLDDPKAQKRRKFRKITMEGEVFFPIPAGASKSVFVLSLQVQANPCLLAHARTFVRFDRFVTADSHAGAYVKCFTKEGRVGIYRVELEQ